MAKKLPVLGLAQIPVAGRILSRIALGVVFIGLLLGYQPTLGFPPIKQNIVTAQSKFLQETSIDKETLPIQFQLMFPGYLSQGYSQYHKALDIATGLGMPIKPIAKGKVIAAGYDWSGYGLKIEIDHGNGYKSLYAHLGKIYVKPGQEITELDSFIGEVGLTGRTSGPHTHLEVKKDNKSVDPQAFLPTIRQMPVASDFQPVGGRKN